MNTFTEIEQNLTGEFSSSELEARLKPQQLHDENSWKDTSSGGFLAPNESLHDVVEADYNTLCSLGITYEEMARLTANILQQVKRESPTSKNTLTRKAERFWAQQWKPVVPINRNDFTWSLIGSNGAQSCPWGCITDRNGYDCKGTGHIYIQRKGEEKTELMERWMKGYTKVMIRSKELEPSEESRKEIFRGFERSLGIEFGGVQRCLYKSSFTVVTDLTPHLIASHYFFEGDASYRTDPRKLVEVMGLRV